MTSWAEREIELACKREAPNRKLDEWDYGCACYESALKAYKSLEEDGHSGCSIEFTRDILNRLISHKPLTPLNDTDNDWTDVSSYFADDKCLSKQHNRYYSLFKDEYSDGRITYTDVSRGVCFIYNKPNSIGFTNSFLTRKILDEMFPITLPYFPNDLPYKIFIEEYLFNKSKGDFDTIVVRYVETPTNEKIEVNRYFSDIDGIMTEIDEKKFNELKERFINEIQ